VISVYRVGDQEYRAGLWEKTPPGSLWHARTGASIPSYLSYYDNMVHRGFRPLFLSVFTLGSTVRTASAWQNVAFSAEGSVIGSRMQSYVRTHQVPGVAIAIAKDGRLVYAAGFGQAERGTVLDATPTTLFRIAGVSHAITAVAVLKLVEAKKLALDDKVFGARGVLGSRFPTSAANQRIELITVKHLLQHSSGFGNTPSDPVSAYAHLAPEEMIRAVLDDPGRALARDPGTRFERSDFGYVVLGRVIEQASGRSYEQYVKADVLAPAGIRSMSIGSDTVVAKKPGEATYYPDAAYALKLANTDAASGWVASAVELARLMVHVDGSSTRPDIIGAASHKLMTTSAGIRAANDADPGYGLGWSTGPQSQSGAMPGSLAYVAVLPDGFAVAAVANTRPASDEGGQSLQSTLRDIISVVKAWPSYDLFDGRLDRPIVAAR
jgi:D-alanyl-D-alanine carboxypeptidase